MNPRTSWAGYLVLAGALLTVIGTALSGGDISAALQQVLLPALAGVGLVLAKDGGP